MVVGGVLLLGVGVYWILAGGTAPTGVFLMLIGALACGPFALADRGIRQRLQGDSESLLEQPVFRYQGVLFGVSGVCFLVVALWSRRTGGEAVISEYLGFVLAGVFTLAAALDFVVVRRLARRET
jgi:drug/metabolite transporter (DMT)-like permease